MDDDFSCHSRMHGADEGKCPDDVERAGHGRIHHDGNVGRRSGDGLAEDRVVTVIVGAARDVKADDASLLDRRGEREEHVAGGVHVNRFDIGRRGRIVRTGGKDGEQENDWSDAHGGAGSRVQWCDDARAWSLRRVRSVVALAITAVALACGSDASGPSEEPEPEPTAADSVAGTFALTAVDAKSIPAAILSEGGYTLEVAASSAALEHGGQLMIVVNTREIVAGFASNYADTLRGTWTQAGTVVRLAIAPENTSTTVGWDGRRLTIGLIVATAEGNYVFTRSP